MHTRLRWWYLLALILKTWTSAKWLLSQTKDKYQKNMVSISGVITFFLFALQVSPNLPILVALFLLLRYYRRINITKRTFLPTLSWWEQHMESNLLIQCDVSHHLGDDDNQIKVNTGY